MKTKNAILGVIIVSSVAILSSCTATLDTRYERPVYNQYNRPAHVINDPDLPPVPYLTPRQIDKIKDIRREERQRVDYLEQTKRQIQLQLDRPNLPKDRDRLQKGLRKVEQQINQEHRRAGDRIYSVLTREQRKHWRR